VKHIRPCVESLAETYPSVLAITGFAGGEVAGILTIAASREGNVHGAGAKAAVRDLAIILANLSYDLLPVFEAAFKKREGSAGEERCARAKLEKAFSKP
jgi:hypothetical protein